MLIEEIISKPVGGVLAYPSEGIPDAIVVLCGANPFLGGRPDNPVAVALARSFASHGLAVFSLEYPAWRQGISSDEFEAMRTEFWANGGPSPRDLGALADAVSFCLSLAPRSMLLLAGYSYGGALAMLAGAEKGIPVFAVSPPLRTLPVGFRCDLRQGCLVAAEDDMALTREEEREFEARCGSRWGVKRVLAGADHFLQDIGADLDAMAGDWLTIRNADR